MVADARKVTAWIGRPGEFAARLPAVKGVVSIPEIRGWSVRPMAELMTRVRGEVVRAVTSNEDRLRECAVSLQDAIDGANLGAIDFNRSRLVSEACKVWCVQHSNDPAALQALCDNKAAPIDGHIASMIVEASARFGEMGRSRVLGAIADRMLDYDTALANPDAVLKVLGAAQLLPWEAPGHERVARAVIALDKELQCEASLEVREGFERRIGRSLADVTMDYAAHQRVAVAEVVARSSERQDVQKFIAERAEGLFSVDSRLAYRLVAALASNPNATHDVLQPFTNPELWTSGVEQSRALGAMLGRMGVTGASSRPVVPDIGLPAAMR